MTITPGPFASTVTQYRYDPDTDAVGTGQLVQALAEFPGNAMEQDSPSGDVITADRVLLFAPSAAVGEYDEFTISDGLRYRVNGAPALYRNPMTGTAVTQVNLRRIT